MTRLRFFYSLACAVALFSVSSPLRADTVQLTNGDVLHGKVQWLNEQSMQLESEIYGELRIQRDKVSMIALGDQAPSLQPTDTARPTTGAPGKMAGNNHPTAAPTLNDIVKQLQTGGIDLESLGDVKKAVPLVAAPEAQKYLTDTLGGLMSGSLSVQDIRRDAINARDQVDELKKTLGPQAGAAFDGYLSILNKFIDESGPPAPKPAPQPKKP